MRKAYQYAVISNMYYDWYSNYVLLNFDLMISEEEQSWALNAIEDFWPWKEFKILSDFINSF